MRRTRPRSLGAISPDDEEVFDSCSFTFINGVDYSSIIASSFCTVAQLRAVLMVASFESK